jgi:hypothetical protein
MTKALEAAFKEAATLPEDRQDRLGQWVRDFVEQERSSFSLSDGQRAEVRRRLDAATPAFATDSEVEALFTRFSGR